MSKNEQSEIKIRDLLVAAGVGILNVIAGFMMKPAGAAARAKTVPAARRIDAPKLERTQDLDQDLEQGVDLERRERWGTAIVLFLMIVGLASGVGFLYSYWSGADNFALGGTLAVCFAALGAALVFWSHLLMRHKEAIEPRETMQSSPCDRQLAFDNFLEGKHDVKRRSLLTWMSAGFAAVFAASFMSLFRSLGAPPGPSLYDTVWKSGQRLMTLDGTPVSVDALQPGSTIVVFPEDSIGDEKAQTVLLRVNEQFLQMPKERADWAPLGYLAYSRICTHAGCPVALYQKHTHLLLCPCHQSTFDVLKGAEPTGGPAARALPQLPLYAGEDGILRAEGGFSTPPGPGFWGMPA